MLLKTPEVDRKVIYVPTLEEGIITSFNDSFVFVRYGNDVHSKATKRRDLEYVS